MKWIKCTERLPESGVYVLVFAPDYNNNGDLIQTSYLTYDNKWFLSSGFCCSNDQYFGIGQITYWAEMPKGPKED